MNKSVNTFKSVKLNSEDVILLDNVETKVLLSEKNDISNNLKILYVYRLPDFQTHGFKVGYTECKLGETFWNAIKTRIDSHVNEVALDADSLLKEDYLKYGLDREVVFWGIARSKNNIEFKDHPFHEEIKNTFPGVAEKKQEWFSGRIKLVDITALFHDYRQNLGVVERKIYTLRKEQREAVNELKKYFADNPEGSRFLLNCKMRFGKCLTTYNYAQEANRNKILILTFVPAVAKSWHDDLYHIEREYDFFRDSDLSKEEFKLDNNPKKPYVIFLSLQNYLGRDFKTAEVKKKIQKLKEIDFDLLVLDEYHFGAWNDRTQETIEEVEEEYRKNLSRGIKDDFAKILSIRTKQTICLSGTPFKAIDRGEFTDKNTFTYSYFDEQKNKYPKSEEGDFSVIAETYKDFPDMKIFGYNMSKLFLNISKDLIIEDRNLKKQYFSLNLFFETKKDRDTDSEPVFIYEEYVKAWLEVIKGRTTHGYQFPFMNEEMLMNNKHTLWLMPTINGCIALTKLLKNDDYFKKYEIINLSDPTVGSGVTALNHLERGIRSSEQKGKLGSIAITVNKLTLGVTVKEWTSVFVLKDLSSPEQYFQSIFRIQTPNPSINKKYGFVYDFNIERAAMLLLDYAEKTSQSITKMDVANLIVKYMPIFMNGDMAHPIEEEIFYELATLGYNSKPLSEKVKDISKTTRGLDDQTIANMLNDKECTDVIKRIFAHSRFPKVSKRRTPPDATPGAKSVESQKGRDIGYEKGLNDYKLYIEIDDEHVQELFDENMENLFKEHCPPEYDNNQRALFHRGLVDGYESGVNVPIKKLQCGRADGLEFAKKIKDILGPRAKWNKDNKAAILNIVNPHLNDKNNIPEEFRKKMFIKWYRQSFLSAIQSSLKPQIKDKSGTTIEDTQNVLRHILSKVFQFLYISVYRETKFSEVFANADPYVFHSAVGIKKEEFEILNKYKVFQERVLDSYIHEFFVNEALGKVYEGASEDIKKSYRNSFNWFGYGLER